MNNKKLIIVSVTIVLIFATAYFLFQLSKSRSYQALGELISSVETTEKVVALTFDDGPGINTDEVLAILGANDIKATFYLTGREINERLDDAKKIVQAGHEIGNHSYSHERMVLKSPSFIKEELATTDALIRESGYEGVITFRPPYGKRLFLLPYYLSKQNKPTILWNIEPETYEDIANDYRKIVNHVLDEIKPGSIILLHVMYESRKESVKAIEPLINSLKAEGYTFLTVSELLQYR